MYFGATLKAGRESQGYLTAIDAATGATRWQYRSDEPMLGAVTTTAGGLLLVGETVGDLLAFDAARGAELYRFNTGGTISGGLVTCSVSGRHYVAVTSGKGSAFIGGPGAPIVVVLSLPQDNALNTNPEVH